MAEEQYKDMVDICVSLTDRSVRVGEGESSAFDEEIRGTGVELYRVICINDCELWRRQPRRGSTNQRQQW